MLNLIQFFFGKPTEPSGFSKNKRETFGPPDFKDVSFYVEDKKTTSLIINFKIE
jgi:uncharacterized protein (DUF2141 family)